MPNSKDILPNNRKSHLRSGAYEWVDHSYWAFIPKPLPPKPEINLTRVEPTLSEANINVGRLDGIAEIVPNVDLFVFMFARKEAVLSSRIEGTQATLDDVLENDAEVESTSNTSSDVSEVVNYINAMKEGIEALKTMPLCLRLLRDIHRVLLHGVRGDEKRPGEFRTTQNAIGPKPLSSYEDAVFVPPPPCQLNQLLRDFESFFHQKDNLPVLVRVGLAHAHFETIHPFNDGNGRLGRLLMTFMLCESNVLRLPLLYISEYFERDRSEYYGWLMRVREQGDWEGWLRYFLTGVKEVAAIAVQTAHKVMALQKKHRDLVMAELPKKLNALLLLDKLAERPIVTSNTVERMLQVSSPTANSLLADFERLGILREVTGRQRDRVFRYQSYMSILQTENHSKR